MRRLLSEMGPSWRDDLGEELWGRVDRAWPTTYDRDARAMIDQALSRLVTAMTRDGTIPLSGAIYDGTISIGPIRVDLVKGRGDFRYRSDNLAAYLRKNPDRELVPIVCSQRRGGYLVLDGHHRLRAYLAADRPEIPAVVVSIAPGSGHVET